MAITPLTWQNEWSAGIIEPGDELKTLFNVSTTQEDQYQFLNSNFQMTPDFEYKIIHIMVSAYGAAETNSQFEIRYNDIPDLNRPILFRFYMAGNEVHAFSTDIPITIPAGQIATLNGRWASSLPSGNVWDSCVTILQRPAVP